MGNSMVEEKLTKEQLAKLPMWAQRHFEMMERALQHAKTEVVTLRAALGEAPLDSSGLVTWSVVSDQYALPDTALVRFNLVAPEPDMPRVYIEVGFRKSEAGRGRRVLWVQGSAGLVVQAHSSNVLSMRTWERNLDE